MNQIPLDVVIQIGGLILSAAVIVIAMKYALNGMRSDVSEIKESVEKLVVSDSAQAAEIAAIKATSGLHQSWMERLEKWVKDGLSDRRSDPR